MDEEEARVDHLLLVTRQEADRVELERLRVAMERQRAMLANGISAQELFDEARLNYETLKKRVDEHASAVAAAAQTSQKSEARQGAMAAPPVDMDLERVLEPIRREAAVQEASIAEIQEQRKRLTLTAPADGEVMEIRKRAGETVLAGESILALRTANALRVVAYMNERALRTVCVGARAELASHYRRSAATKGEVVRVGSQIELMPLELQPNPMAQEHGLALVVDGIKENVFYPGERVDVVFHLAPSASR